MAPAEESACNVEDLGSIPGLGRSPGEGNGYPLQYSGLENSMDCIVHGVTKSRTPHTHTHTHTQSISQWLSGKESAWNAGVTEDVGLIPGWERSPGGNHGNPLQFSCLENSMERGAW